VERGFLGTVVEKPGGRRRLGHRNLTRLRTADDRRDEPVEGTKLIELLV
jgi:hypothetical protein